MTLFALTERSNRISLTLLCTAVLLAAIPHAWHLSPAIVGFSLGLTLWRGLALWIPLPLPNRWVLLLATLMGGAAVIVYSNGILGRDAGTALFLVGLALKLLELRTTRDVYLVVFLIFLVAITQYLYDQDLPIAFYTLAIAVLPITVLIRLNSSQAPLTGHAVKLALQLLGLSIPLTAVLFVFFPRLPGPLWQLPDDHAGAVAGLSDTVEPGSISKLSLSEALAFRATFSGEPPPARDRYWRGPVFWYTDGKRWTLDDNLRNDYPPPQPAVDAKRYAYRIMLEPHRQNWVLALDWPIGVTAGLRQNGSLSLEAGHKLTEREPFSLESASALVPSNLTPRDRQRALQLPSPVSEPAVALVNGWTADNPTPAEVVARALRYFRTENFAYTLNPPTLPDHPIERFLFETRRGFCEHYATAFVYLMRIANLPARLVTGYQGGQWNAIGGFIEVRQADAHAWTEVWLPDSGWLRIDPTAAIAPERIERGVDLGSQLRVGEVAFNGLPGLRSTSGLREWVQGVHAFWASLDHAWQLWILAYGPEQQQRLLSWLGIQSWQTLVYWLAGAVAALFGLAAWVALRPRQEIQDPVSVVYQKLCDELARQGLPRRSNEGPRDFCRRVVVQKPEWAESFTGLLDLYIELRYENSSRRHGIEAFRHQFALFRRQYLRNSASVSAENQMVVTQQN